jgi:hypothetical protein
LRVFVIDWGSIAYFRQLVKPFAPRVLYARPVSLALPAVEYGSPPFRLQQKNDQITRFRSFPSTPVVSHSSFGLSSLFPGVFLRSGQRSPSRIPCPSTSLASAKAASRSLRSFPLFASAPVVSHTFRKLSRGFGPLFSASEKLVCRAVLYAASLLLRLLHELACSRKRRQKARGFVSPPATATSGLKAPSAVATLA